MNNVHLLQLRDQKRVRCTRLLVVISRERKCSFSLEFRSIGSLVLDGARSKAILRDEGYAWAPIWWSSNNSKR